MVFICGGSRKSNLKTYKIGKNGGIKLIRVVNFTVDSDGISPATKQFGGVQGEHRATELIFTIQEALFKSLEVQVVNGAKLIYRFDGYDGEGGFCRSDTSELTTTQVTYPLENWLTEFGGIVKVVLVISLLKNDTTEMELYSFPALLQLKSLPEGREVEGESYESMSVLAQVAKDSASTAVSSAEAAVEAKEKTELARAALEGGTLWVFDGGDAEGNVDLDGDELADINTADIKFIIDGEMSGESENAVKNKVIKEYIDNLEKKIKSDVLKLAHPAGSYYWSSDPTDPSELFGGSWEQIEGKFVIAAGTYKDKNNVERTFEVGEVDGEYLHKLEIDEMPSHNHDVYMYCNYGGGSQTISGKFIIESNNYVSWSVGERTNINMGFLNTTNLSGDNIPHNNMPPYIVAYCWKRIS